MIPLNVFVPSDTTSLIITFNGIIPVLRQKHTTHSQKPVRWTCSKIQNPHATTQTTIRSLL